jgi:hypothetical protein
VVAVIDELQEAGGAGYIEFQVRRSPANPDRVVGIWCLAHGERVIDQSRPDSPVAAEFRFAVDCADQHGIAFVWVNDPEELFPPWERR